MNPNIASNWISTIIVLAVGLWALIQIVSALPGFEQSGIIIAATTAAIIIFIRKGVRQ